MSDPLPVTAASGQPRLPVPHSKAEAAQDPAVELRRREAQLAHAQALAHMGSWDWDIESNELSGSDEMYRIYGFDLDEPLSTSRILSRIHPDDAEALRIAIDGAVMEGRDFDLEHRVVRPDGQVRLVHSLGRVVRNQAGATTSIIGAGHDITDRRDAEHTARRLSEETAARSVAEGAQRRAELVAAANGTLGTSFDYQTTLSQTAHLFVPTLAEYCTIDLVTEAGRIQRVGVAHVEPEKEAMLRRAVLRAEKEGLATAPHLARAIHAGQSTLLPSFSSEYVLANTVDDEHRNLLLALDPHSLLCVPLRSGERVIGALTLYASDESRHFDDDDLHMAQEVAVTAGLAVENARLYARAQAATAARDQMLSVVAHDLRNPLNTMLMASELVEDMLPPDSPSRQHVAIVRRAGASMNRLIQDLLDVRRMETGKLSVETKGVAVESLLGAASEMLRPLAEKAGLTFLVEVEPGLPPVQADTARIQQVLSNLVGNALKFTPRGGTIRLGAARAEAVVRVEVEDTGPGIAAEHLPQLFGQSWQATAGDRRGIGLGLTIARGIVEAHGGSIGVDSVVGQGTMFHFTLPAAADGAV